MPQPFKLAIPASSLLLYLAGVCCSVLISFGAGAIVVLVASAIMLVFYFLQLRDWKSSNTLSVSRISFATLALIATAVIYVQGFSVSINSSLFNIPGFYKCYIIAGVVLLIAFAIVIIHSIWEAEVELRRKILITSIGIFVVLSGIGYLAFLGVLRAPTRLIYFSFVFQVLFFLVFFITAGMHALIKRTSWHPSDRIGLALSGLMAIVWLIRWESSPNLTASTLIKLLLDFGPLAVIILPLAIVFTRKTHYLTVFIFYALVLDVQFLPYNMAFREFASLGGDECTGYANAENPPLIQEPGVSFKELLRPPDEEEISSIRNEWSEKKFMSSEMKIEYKGNNTQGDSIKVLSHVYDGRRHYGLIRIPRGVDVSHSPILLALHGGGSEADVLTEDELYRFTRGCAVSSQHYITIAPSFRGDVVRGNGFCFRSEGYTGDVWTGATEDAAAFLEAFKELHRAKPSTVVAMGISRGATVALLLGGLTRHVNYVIAISTHTDFINENVFRTERVGSDYARVFFTPQATPEVVRKRLISSSPYYFAEFLPPFEIHQGTEDHLTTVWHTKQLEQKLKTLSRPDSTFTIRYYNGMGHGGMDERSVCERLGEIFK